jgi:predicted enzyme related to lactoylglutathione lyase/catechol 2,3-dioxygenase-like lactoylglutathione lyase family enzyme
MTSQLSALCLDANDPLLVARFWRSLLGWQMADLAQDGITIQPTDDTGFQLRVLPSQEPKSGPNPLHLHLTSTSLEDQRQTVARSLGLGARHIDVGQRPEEGHIVLADPEGNEFCVIEPGNKWLAGCGFLAELACDGSRPTGHFWSAALGWPLNWDQDEETSIRSPHGGPKISWGGPPLMPKSGKDRFHFDLAPPAGGDLQAEVDRLVALGATCADIGQGKAGWIVLADPDGHEFCLRPA